MLSGITSARRRFSSFRLLLRDEANSTLRPGTLRGAGQSPSYQTVRLSEVCSPRSIVTSIDGGTVFRLELRREHRCEGMRDTVPVDFCHGWGKGLEQLLTALRGQKDPCGATDTGVAKQWEGFRIRQAVRIIRQTETLTSNWIYIAKMPDEIHYYEAVGFQREGALMRQVSLLTYPAVHHDRGLITFTDPHVVAEAFYGLASLRLDSSTPVTDFLESGFPKIGLKSVDAFSMMTGILRHAWERFCRSDGVIAYTYAVTEGFHVSAEQAPNGAKISSGRQGGERRSSMLRTVARGHIRKYGVTAVPKLWPFWHVR